MPYRDKEQRNACVICLNVDLPTKYRATRSAKKDSWICCDCCKCWFHAYCGGFTPSQYIKINKDNLWLKCTVCCLQQIYLTDCSDDDSSLLSLAVTAAKNRVSEAASEKLHKQKIISEVKQDSGKSQLRRGNAQNLSCSHTEESFRSEVSSVTASVSSLSKPELSVHSHDSSTVHAGANFVSFGSKSDLSRPSQLSDNLVAITEANTVSFVHESDRCGSKPVHNLVTEPAESDIDKILVIDSIDNSVEFSSSRRILNEVHNFFPEVKIEFAYSLAKGGVAIHTTNKADRDLLLEHLPAESFGRGIKHPPKGQCSEVLFIKGIDTSVDLSSFTKYLQEEEISVFEIRRLTKRHSGKPTQVIKLKCCYLSAARLLNTKLVVNNKPCLIEKERAVRVIRCFNCQSLGHLAKHCKRVRFCEFCACSHGEQDWCLGNVQCVNCCGAHPSSSSDCPVYISRYAFLTKQHTEHQHVSSTPVSKCLTLMLFSYKRYGNLLIVTLT